MRTCPTKPFRRAKRTSRSALAPLELVLWLPVLLMVTALMVNIGTSAAWRVRGEIVARDAAWRVRWERTGIDEPRPIARVWPANATMNVDAGPRMDRLDLPEVQHPVVRGPQLGDGRQSFNVHNLFDPAPGMVVGSSSIERRYPLLAKLGSYRSGQIENPLFTRKWQVAQMGLPANVTRRTLELYELPKTDPSLPQAYANAVRRLFQMPGYQNLSVLDRDEEVRQFTGGYVDFHPHMRHICSFDPDEVRDGVVANPRDHLVDILNPRNDVELGQIHRLPRRMTNFFLNMYQNQLGQLQQTPGGQGQAAAMQGSIEQLERFLQRLDGLETQLRNQSRDRLR